MRVEEKWSWEWPSSASHGQGLGRDFGPASPLLSTSFLNSGFSDISHYLLSTDFVPGIVLGTQYKLSFLVLTTREADVIILFY